jgi:hypothetical protein
LNHQVTITGAQINFEDLTPYLTYVLNVQIMISVLTCQDNKKKILNSYALLRKNPPKSMKGMMTTGEMARQTSRLGVAQDRK